MFPVIMLILQFLWRRFHLWIDQFTAACHLCNFLKYNCIVHCLMRIFAPGKRTMILAKFLNSEAVSRRGVLYNREIHFVLKLI